MEIVKELSKHFIDRWVERCGGVPCVEGVNRILLRSQRIRGQHVFWCIKNGEFCQSSSPAVFWSHSDGLIIQVDLKRGKAVTVIVPQECVATKRGGGNGNGKRKNHKKAGGDAPGRPKTPGHRR